MEDSCGDPCVKEHRLERSPEDRDLVAPELWVCAEGGKNRRKKIYSLEPGWHDPSDCVGCIGDSLAPRARREGDASEERGGSVALEVRHLAAADMTAAEWEGGRFLDQQVGEEHRMLAVVEEVVVAGDAVEEDVVAERREEQDAAAAEGEEGGVAIEVGSRKNVVVEVEAADGDHQAQVGRRRDEI